jgi:hypothetical protein
MRQSSVQVAERARAMLAELTRLGDYNDTMRYVRELAELIAELAEATRESALTGLSRTRARF